MKTIIFLTVITITFSYAFSQPQKIGVYKSNEELYIYKISEIDSIVFSDYFLCPGIPQITYEGQIYYTVLIGDQCWLKENLNVGNMIPGAIDQTENAEIEKYCYGNNSANCDTYGGLYQWNEAMQYVTTEGAQGICPEGWHIPTLSEFQVLAATVNNDGNALKAIGQGSGSGAGTNTSGFSALLGGQRYPEYFQGLDLYTQIWSSSRIASVYIYYLDIEGPNSNIYLLYKDHYYGSPVRCIKD